jgi:hypothetical protein
VLHRLLLGDRPAELHALKGIARGRAQHGTGRAGDQERACERAPAQDDRAAGWQGGGVYAQFGHGVDRDRRPGLSGEIDAW